MTATSYPSVEPCVLFRFDWSTGNWNNSSLQNNSKNCIGELLGLKFPVSFNCRGTVSKLLSFGRANFPIDNGKFHFLPFAFAFSSLPFVALLSLTFYSFLFVFAFDRSIWFVATITNITFVSIDWCCYRNNSLYFIFSIERAERNFKIGGRFRACVTKPYFACVCYVRMCVQKKQNFRNFSICKRQKCINSKLFE